VAQDREYMRAAMRAYRQRLRNGLPPSPTWLLPTWVPTLGETERHGCLPLSHRVAVDGEVLGWLQRGRTGVPPALPTGARSPLGAATRTYKFSLWNLGAHPTFAGIRKSTWQPG
jgi:hypothetical protein